VLVHGLSGSARWWHETEDALRERHAVHTLDLPGFGSQRRERFDLHEAPRHVGEVLERIGPANLVGHSLGGLVAARVAARRPELVERLVLVAPVGALPPASLPVHGARLATAVVRARPAFVRMLVADALRAGPWSLLRIAREVLLEDVVPELRDIRAPTLLVWGDRDPLVPPEVGVLFAGAIPDARIRLVSDARHVPMLERPREFAALLEEFLV
jgi:pimeloyl-ACP methyl ester carboxylesterase